MRDRGYVGRRTRCPQVSALSIVLLGWGLQSADKASAAYATCQPRTPGSYFAGATSGEDQKIYGSRARIDFKDPDLCDNNYAESNGVSAAWTMVAADSRVTSDQRRAQYAQVGYYDAGSLSGYASGKRLFTQYTTTCSSTVNGCTASQDPFTTAVHGTPSGTHTYVTLHNNVVGAPITMYYDGDPLASTDYTPTATWAPAWDAQFLGETQDRGDDVPGTSGNRTRFEDLVYYNSSGTQVYLQPGDVGEYDTTGTRYDSRLYDPIGVGARAVEIWSCPSTPPC